MKAIAVLGATLACVTALVVNGEGATASPEPTSARLPCAAPRVFVESQSWWKPAPGAPDTATDFGHVHLGACIPERDVLRRKTTIPVRLIMHENPGRLADVSVVLKGTDYEDTVTKVAPVRRRCSRDATCEQWIDVPLAPAQFRHSGLQEVRLRVYVDEPDGKRMHTSLNWQVRVRNGRSRENVTRYPYLRGKGWYTDFGYCEADLLTRPLPDRPVSGDLVLEVQQVDHGPDDVDPTHSLVALDADAHAGIPGTVLVDRAGPLSQRSLTIDTTQLVDGLHRLVQRVDCQDGDQVNSGVLVLTFATDNP